MRARTRLQQRLERVRPHGARRGAVAQRQRDGRLRVVRVHVGRRAEHAPEAVAREAVLLHRAGAKDGEADGHAARDGLAAVEDSVRADEEHFVTGGLAVARDGCALEMDFRRGAVCVRQDCLHEAACALHEGHAAGQAVRRGQRLHAERRLVLRGGGGGGGRQGSAARAARRERHGGAASRARRACARRRRSVHRRAAHRCGWRSGGAAWRAQHARRRVRIGGGGGRCAARAATIRAARRWRRHGALQRCHHGAIR